MAISIWRASNLTLAFTFELVALAALGYWGFRTGSATATKILLTLGIPVLAAALWGMFAAPQATFHIPALAVLTKIAVFGAASAALWQLDHRIVALAFPALVVANLAVVHLGRMTPATR